MRSLVTKVIRNWTSGTFSAQAESIHSFECNAYYKCNVLKHDAKGYNNRNETSESESRFIEKDKYSTDDG